ncbi:DUF2066 domain-containing protein [Methyloligella halotolerans]|uniref:DUF2066 domain-containing protein n=1 Tax=Methyloligella halotolerans TaxID=1177755 RepID=UPI0014719BF1|nr:DUF2066 domain-containing protein [Methyloligella halotolerans]
MRSFFHFICLAILVFAPIAVQGDPAQAAGSLYDVDKIDVDVTAANAVAAQKKAMAEAQAKGAQVLFRRLVPPEAHDRLPQLSSAEVESLVTGVSIGSERYSTTRYIASLGVSYSEAGVQQLLSSYGLPIEDSRAMEIKLLPVVIDQSGAPLNDSKLVKAWTDGWNSVDLAHAVAPADLVKRQGVLDQQRLSEILNGNIDAYEFLQNEIGGPLVIAIAEQKGETFSTRLFGADAVSEVDLIKDVPIRGDLDAAAMAAAEQDFAALQDRWKSMQSGAATAMPEGSEPPSSGGGGNWFNFGGRQQQPEAAPAPRNNGGGWFNFGGRQQQQEEAPPPAEYIVARVEFQGLMGWQEARSRLANVPGIERLEVNSLSPQGASITFDYAGSLNNLQQDLAQNGFSFEPGQGEYVLRAY